MGQVPRLSKADGLPSGFSSSMLDYDLAERLAELTSEASFSTGPDTSLDSDGPGLAHSRGLRAPVAAQKRREAEAEGG